MTRASLILAVISVIAFAVIYLGMVQPLNKPVPTFTATGTVVGRVFQAAHSIGKVGHAMKTGNEITVGDHYLVDVRLDSGEILRGSWPVPTIDALPVGAKVRVRFQRRVLMGFWKRTWVDDIEPLPKE